MKNTLAANIFAGSFYYGISSIIGKAIGFFMLPIYTSHLTPADYGVISFLMFYVTLSQLLFGSKLDQAVSKYYHDSPSIKNLNSIWYSAVLTSSGILFFPLIFTLLASDAVSSVLFSNQDYSLVVKIFSLNIFLSITENYGLLYFRLKEKPKLYLAISIVKLFLQLAFNIWLVVIEDYGIVGVAISSVSGSALVTIISFFIIVKDLKWPSVTVEEIKKLVLFSLPLWATAFFGLYTSSIQVPILNFLSGAGAVGLFSLGVTISSLIILFIWQPFFNYWQVERFKIAQETSEQSEKYSIIYYGMLTLSLLATLFLGLFAKPVIAFMSAPDFVPAASIVFPMTLSCSLMYQTYYFNFPFLLHSKNEKILKINIASAASLTALLAIFIYFFGFQGAAWALCINNFLTLVVTQIISKKELDMGVSIFKSNGLIVIFIFAYLLLYEFSEGLNGIMEIMVRAAIFISIGIAILFVAAIALRKTIPLLNKGKVL